MVMPRQHLPVPIFQQQECRVLLIGFACLRCGLELRRSRDLISSRSAPAPYRKQIHSLRGDAGSTAALARV
jgi:hypothetical protein